MHLCGKENQGAWELNKAHGQKGFFEWGNPKYDYHCLVKNNQLILDGGNGVIVNECRPVISIMGTQCRPEEWCEVVGGAVYDPDKKLLWYAGFLWNEE